MLPRIRPPCFSFRALSPPGGFYRAHEIKAIVLCVSILEISLVLCSNELYVAFLVHQISATCTQFPDPNDAALRTMSTAENERDRAVRAVYGIRLFVLVEELYGTGA